MNSKTPIMLLGAKNAMLGIPRLRGYEKGVLGERVGRSRAWAGVTVWDEGWPQSVGQMG